MKILIPIKKNLKKIKLKPIKEKKQVINDIVEIIKKKIIASEVAVISLKKIFFSQIYLDKKTKLIRRTAERDKERVILS